MKLGSLLGGGIYFLVAVVQGCSVKKVFLEIGCPQACNFIKKEALAQVFSCEFCEIFKNTFFHRTPLVAFHINKF